MSFVLFTILIKDEKIMKELEIRQDMNVTHICSSISMRTFAVNPAGERWRRESEAGDEMKGESETPRGTEKQRQIRKQFVASSWK